MPIAASDVAIAGRSCQRPESSSSGTTMIPPPTPNSALKKPAAIPIRTSCTTLAYSPRMVRHGGRWSRASPSSPTTAGVLLDVDGTLAPIVDRAGRRGRPRGHPRAPARASPRRYALVACVSGRTEEDARRVVGVDELVYVGEHGMGLDPRAEEWGDELDQPGRRRAAGSPSGRTYSAAFHYRTAADEAAAVASLRKVERRAVELGLRARWGRKGARGAAAGRREQGHRRSRAPRRARAPSCALRGRRLHRSRGVPRARRPRPGGAGRGRLRRGPEPARPARPT